MQILSSTTSSGNSQHSPLAMQKAANPQHVVAEPPDIDTIFVESHVTDSSLQDMRQTLARIETTLGNRVTEQFLSHFIGQIAELNESLKQKNQALDVAIQERAVFKESLEAKEKECETLRQKLEENKQVCEEEHQAALGLARYFKAIQQMKDLEWKIRKEGVSTFIRIGDLPKGVEPYITPLLKDPVWQVRKAAFSAIGWHFPAAQAKQELIPLLQDQDWSIRQAVINLLCDRDRLSASEVEKEIIPLLKDPAWQVRQTTIDVLGKRLPQARLKQEITPLLQDTNGRVRDIATYVLGRF